jgi:hypothetical protein
LSSGYSGTPLPKKLGIKAGSRLAILNAPPRFRTTLGTLPPEVDIVTNPGEESFDVMVFFAKGLADLETEFERLAARLVHDGGLWIAWPKRASGIATDLTEDIVRGVGLKAGLVDNKVCAVDETWSGLRFVIRLKDRPNLRGGQ